MIDINKFYIRFEQKHENIFKILIFIFRMVSGIISYFLIFILKCIKVFKKVQIYRVFARNYGHFIFNTEIALRRNILKKSKNILVGIVDFSLPNSYLFKIYKRDFYLIKLPFMDKLKEIYIIFIDAILSPNSIFGKSEFFFNNNIDCNTYEEFNHPYFNDRFLVNFTNDEIKKSEKLKSKMGLTPDDWCICFHNRDDKYLTEFDGSNLRNYHNFRNCSQKNFIPPAEYIAEQGGFALRMGVFNKFKLIAENGRIIDYISNLRTEFGDIYLTGNCKFFHSNTSGIILSSVVRNRPIARTNVITL